MKITLDIPCELCSFKTRTMRFSAPKKAIALYVRCGGCFSAMTVKIWPAKKKGDFHHEVTKLARSKTWDKRVREKDEEQFRVGW